MYNQLPNKRIDELWRFAKSNAIRFRDITFLNLAFSHRSYVNESPQTTENNERLEFLGDSVLGHVVADYLFRELPDRPEGDLAKIKSFVVSAEILSQLALETGIPDYLLIGRGEELSGGRKKKAILADAMEAVFGALYLDSGFEPAQAFILKLLVPQINIVLENRHSQDYKTLLQELVQKKHKTFPRYLLLDKKGPDHNRTFFMAVEIQGKIMGEGSGKNKKGAEQKAAEMAYRKLKA